MFGGVVAGVAAAPRSAGSIAACAIAVKADATGAACAAVGVVNETLQQEHARSIALQPSADFAAQQHEAETSPLIAQA